jgi:hypothetical protein
MRAFGYILFVIGTMALTLLLTVLLLDIAGYGRMEPNEPGAFVVLLPLSVAAAVTGWLISRHKSSN